MANSLFAQLRAAVDVRSATDSSLRVRDLVATGQVTQHVADSSVTSYEEPQGGGGSCTGEDGPCDLRCEADPYFMCPSCRALWANARGHGDEPCPLYVDTPALDGAYPSWHPMLGDVTYATVSGPVVCDIATDEAAEQEAAERAFLRSFGMGTWLTSQPTRFRYATPAYRGSSR